MQDSDEMWQASPPAQVSMERMLKSENVTLAFGWELRRNAPVPGQHSGPDCAGIQEIVLATDTSRGLRKLIKVKYFRVLTCLHLNDNVQVSHRATLVT